MTFAEILPDADSLSRFDKLRLIRHLAEQLENDDRQMIEEHQTYSIWSPYDSFQAAETLLQALGFRSRAIFEVRPKS